MTFSEFLFPIPSSWENIALAYPGLQIHLLEFNAARFDAAAFQRIGLDYPPAIARSVPSRQAEFFFGRLAARRALAQLDHANVQIPAGAQGQPLWPAGLIGSISHAAGRAAAIALPQGSRHGIGIDIEALLEGAALADVEQLVFSKEELALFAGCTGATRAQLLTVGFSAKESFYKAAAASAGGFFGFEAMRIEAVNWAAGHLDFALAATLSAELPAGLHGRIHFTGLDERIYLTAFLW